MTHIAHSGPAAPSLPATGSLAEVRRIALFLAVGLVGVSVDAAIFTALFDAGASRPLARALAIVCATAVTYGLNSRLTFAATARGARGEILRYALVTLASQGFSYGLFLAACALVPALPTLAALAAGAIAAAVMSFAGQRLFTFRGA